MEVKIFVWWGYPESNGILKFTTWTPYAAWRETNFCNLRPFTMRKGQRTIKHEQRYMQNGPPGPCEVDNYDEHGNFALTSRECGARYQHQIPFHLGIGGCRISEFLIKRIKAARWHPIRRRRPWKKRADVIRMRSKILIVATCGDPVIRHEHGTSSSMRLRFPAFSQIYWEETTDTQARPRVPLH